MKRVNVKQMHVEVEVVLLAQILQSNDILNKSIYLKNIFIYI